MAESDNLNILIETGTDFVLPFTIYDNNGDPLDLTGATVESQLREYAEAYDFFEFACMHNGSGGRITVTMPHETTAQIPFTHGVYDVKVTLADGTISHPLSGEVYVKEGVTKSTDGSILFMLGINSFEDLPEVGNVDRLYFVYSDRKIYRWNGTNYIATSIGNGIQSIDFVEHVDTFTDKYRITLDDGTHFDYLVTTRGIDHISLIGSTGTVRTGVIDQYRIYFSDDTTHDYYVTNGRAFDVKTSYDATQAYEYLDMVKSNGATYVAVQDVPANTAITNTDYWLKIFAPLTIGTVTTVGAQELADASIGGTADAPVLNLTIPRGVTGNESIDDTKGEGDTDYVWSADRSYILQEMLQNISGIVYKCHRTFSQAGNKYFTFNPPIPANTDVYIRNDASSNSNFSVNLIDENGTETNYFTVNQNKCKMLTTQSKILRMRSWAAGSEYTFTIIPHLKCNQLAVDNAQYNGNFYDPSFMWIYKNASGSVLDIDKMIDDTTGNIICKRNYGSHGQTLIENPFINIGSGKYRLSCHCTMDAGAPIGTKKVIMRIGDADFKTRSFVTDSETKSADLSADFTITQKQAFCFELVGNSSDDASSTYPATFSNIVIRRIESVIDEDEVKSITGITDTNEAIFNSHRMIYVNETAEISFTNRSDGGIEIHVGDRLVSRLQTPYNSTALNWDDISTDISSNITIDGYTADIVMTGYSKQLVFNTNDGQLHIRNLTSNSLNYLHDIVLVSNGYNQPICGILYDLYIARLAKKSIGSSAIFNAEPYSETYDWQTPVVSYGALFNGRGNNVESFAFYTDSHVMGFGDSSRNTSNMMEYFKKLQKVYNATPCSFLVSGGDFLNNGTSADEACYRLGYLKGIFNHLLDGCYLVIGNHDTNYQGTERLSNETIAAILYRDTDTHKAYYSFDGANSKCYVLDTGIEHSNMLAYDWEQVDWLANKLISDDAEHSIIFLHIILNNDAVQTNTSNFATLVKAYNLHSTVTLNGVTYDFSATSGKVELFVGGHTHSDSTGTLEGVPYFITSTRGFSYSIPLIDLVLVDYDEREVKLIRAGGTGDDRTIALA